MFENIIFFSFGYCYFISLLRTQGVPILLHLHICEERPILQHCTPTLAKKWQYFHFLLPLDFDLGQLDLPKYFCVDLDIKHPSHLYDYGTCCSAREFNCCHALILTNGNFKNSLLSGLFEYLTMTYQYSFTLHLDHKFYIF